MRALRIVVVGPGRAGGSMALAARRAGHEIVGLVIGPSGRVPQPLEDVLAVTGDLPEADLMILAVRDDDITAVTGQLEGRVDRVESVCHLSGFTTVEALAPLRDAGCDIGSFHPVQSLPDASSGSVSLRGSYAAITGDLSTLPVLAGLAESLGMIVFELADDLKPLHHAAASAASNFVVASLALAVGLGELAGVPPETYQPLTANTVANAYRMGPADALTGPVARGDVRTVSGQLAAVSAVSEELARAYSAMVAATASLTPHEAAFRKLMRSRS